jgi:hypothetical protein
MEIDRNETPAQRRGPWALVAAGVAMIALATVGMRALMAVLHGFGLATETYDVVIGTIVINLIGGGVVVFLVGLILALVRSRVARSIWLIGSGLVLLLGGSGPLVVVLVSAQLGLTADRNPNPVLQGVLASVTLLPAVILIICGLVARADRARGRAR